MKRLWILISFFIFFLLLLGYGFWYRIAARDHIIDFVPEDTIFYLHDRSGVGKEIVEKMFPNFSEQWNEGKESAVVWQRNGEVAIYTREQKRVFAQTENGSKTEAAYSGIFREKHLGGSITKKNYGHFPIYGIVEEAFGENVPDEILPTNFPKTFFIHGNKSRLFVRAQENLSWGYIPLFDMRRTEESTWIPASASFVIENDSVSLWNGKLGFLGDFGRIAELTDTETFAKLTKPKRIMAQNEVNKKSVWALSWDISAKPLVEQLLVQLAGETFPTTKDGSTLPDGTPTKEFTPRTDTFPGHQTEVDGVSYTEYKKDDWELGLFERDGESILTNAPKDLAKLFPNPEAKSIYPRCGRGDTGFFWKNADASSNGLFKTFFLTQKKKIYLGCVEI